ncbi:MAG: hypothetical protein LBB72_04335 [Spirochaetaceae bacterium]|jgi:hypothetical protein|nr:hypothetical protein [Spirochaetaceae bacterium]
MKKMKVVFPVLFLLLAGLVMTNCTSDPPPPIDDFDFELKGGKYQFVFDTPKIEHGKTYEVIFTIENCDEGLIGSHLGGKICYKMDLDSEDEDDKLLSGWLNSVPNTVSKNVKTYKWTFEAGKRNEDSLTPETDATTPEGGKQYFSLTAQDASWHDYSPTDNFKVKGGFTVNEKKVITDWESEGEVTLSNEETANPGKGNLTDEDMAKIRALPAGSIIELTITVTVKATAEGGAGPQAGWGVGQIGTWTQDEGVSINVPGDAEEGEITFTVRIEIADILEFVGDDNIALNLWDDAKCTKAELFKPGT